MQVTAIDTQGNKFVKTIITRTAETYRSGELVICFGWPVEYYFKDLQKHYPFQKDMCIDMMGLNHKGSKVTISAEQMDKIIEEFVK